MSRQVVEIPVEVWEQCMRDAEKIAALHRECLILNAKVERLTADNEQLQNRCDFLEGKGNE